MAGNVNTGTLPSKYSDRSILVSPDMVEAAKRYVDTLKLIHQNVNLKSNAVIRNAIWRYEVFWLPMVSKIQRKTEWNAVKKTQLIPPLDVYWIWICHMLSPKQYQMDCNSLVYSVPDHTLLAEPERAKAMSRTRELWQKTHTDQPFETMGATNSEILDNYSSQCKHYNLADASTTQIPFYFQVSLLHYRKNQFLAWSFDRYKKFLFLKKEQPDLFIIPTYDIELMWHSHLLHPVLYGIDMSRTIGTPLIHDNLVINPSPTGNKLNSYGDSEARALWKRWTGEDFAGPGTWYRDDLETSQLHVVTAEENNEVATKECSLLINDLNITGADVKGRFLLKMCKLDEQNMKTFFFSKVINVKHPLKKPAKVEFDNGRHHSLLLSITQTNKCALLSNTLRKAVHEIEIDHVIQESVSAVTHSSDIQLSAKGRNKNHNQNWTASFNASTSKPVRGIYILTPDVSEFTSNNISDIEDDNIRRVFDTIPHPKSTLRNAGDCIMAEHRLVKKYSSI